MKEYSTAEKIYEIEREISLLPSGNITRKKIKDRVYYYYRLIHNGRRKETYLPFEEVELLQKQIDKRKQLTEQLNELKRSSPYLSVQEREISAFRTYIRTGASLQRFAEPVKNLKKRNCFAVLQKYVYGAEQNRVLILYGLRRTGKTTMIRQLIAEMKEEVLQHAAFLQIRTADTLADVNADLRKLENQGYKYVFIDEATLLKDFIEGAAMFPDIYVSSGMKIVLSGTDSLGFLLSADDQLYDRCILLRTTFIPYYELENVLGIRGIDEYIRFGGTMSAGKEEYHDFSVFKDRQNTDAYVNAAIALNIQHSLMHYQDGCHFRALQELYEKRELTSAVNRVVEDMNHRFTVNVLTRTFVSGDLAVSARNLRKDRTHPADILDRIDSDRVTESLKKALEILDIEEQQVPIEEDHAAEIKEYLQLLDLVEEIDLVYLPDLKRKNRIAVITQPGLRYAQADALAESLLTDEVFRSLTLEERERILERIRSEIKGRMMEEIVLLETQTALKNRKVFKLQFASGEFDMVIFDPQNSSCEIFEIKHSKERAEEQYRYLIDPEKCSETEHRFGKITGRYVIYRGDSCRDREIRYWNVEEYLKNLYTA